MLEGGIIDQLIAREYDKVARLASGHTIHTVHLSSNKKSGTGGNR
jgi:hypothetical protein